MKNQHLKTLTNKSTSDHNKASVSKIDSHALFAGSQEVIIEHDEQLYCLHITRQNKLKGDRVQALGYRICQHGPGEIYRD